MERHIILLEHDEFMAEDVDNIIQGHIAKTSVTRLATEEDFRSAYPHLREDPPDLFILGAHVRWNDPAPDMPVAPEDVVRNGFRTAGLRCARLIRAEKQTRKVPIILFTPDHDEIHDGLKKEEMKWPDKTTAIAHYDLELLPHAVRMMLA